MHPDSSLETLFRPKENEKIALKKLGLKTVRDLLYHFPTRYGDTSEKKNIGSLEKGEQATIFGRISNLKTSKGFRTKIPMSTATIEDESGKIKAVWFHQPYIAKMIADGALVRLDGTVSERKEELYFSNPKVEKIGKLPIGVGNSLFGEEGEAHALYPVYPESRGVSSEWLTYKIQKIFSSGLLDTIPDPIPEYILNTYNLPTLKTALVWMHAPQKREHALSARKRFAFEEIFLIQLQKKQERIAWNKDPAYVIDKSPAELDTFISRFPFGATGAQKRAIDTIMSDFRSGHAMARLLEGDVGSGKTAVAASTAFAAVMSRPKGQTYGSLQVAYMAPTEILAKQHFESFIQYFTYLGISVGLITGTDCRKFPSKVNPKSWTKISRTQLLKWVANGEIPILIGTHALIQKSVKFKHLAYAIIDEQHRFGTAQRQKITKKNEMHPHLLSMTATPIPRTLALTMYGDLDLSLLDELPAGRKKIETEIVMPGDREKTYEKVRAILAEGRQAYVICPRIDVPDPAKEQAVIAKSVKEEALRLKKDIFPEYAIGILHSKMKPEEKEKAMQTFEQNKTQILVATSVVEVGVNVPNATVIIIEGAERFGLAQLHQLRGRVQRSSYQPYCFVFAETKSDKTVDRLRAFKSAANGFELAEYDLKLRGAGELAGGQQWGISDIGMEAIRNLKMVEAARAEAEHILSFDETLAQFPLLRAELAERKKAEIHFE